VVIFCFWFRKPLLVVAKDLHLKLRKRRLREKPRRPKRERSWKTLTSRVVIIKSKCTLLKPEISKPRTLMVN
jgi:hypothetical protein